MEGVITPRSIRARLTGSTSRGVVSLNTGSTRSAGKNSERWICYGRIALIAIWAFIARLMGGNEYLAKSTCSAVGISGTADISRRTRNARGGNWGCSQGITTMAYSLAINKSIVSFFPGSTFEAILLARSVSVPTFLAWSA